MLGAGAASAQGPAPFGPAVPQPTWTQRLMSPFTGGSDADKAQRDAAASAQAAEEQRLRFDPLALGNGTGEPTPDFFVGMAEISARGGNVPQARQLYQKALAKQPTHLEALLGAARMEDREGHLDVATTLYQRAANAHSNNPTVLNDLALCLARQNQIPAAERALQRAIQLDPAKPLYRNNMAKVQIELNRLDVACTHLAAVYPAPIVNYNMGVLLFQRGRNAESERYLNGALAMEPRMVEARAILAQIHPQQPVYQTARAPQRPMTFSAPVDVTSESPINPTPVGPQLIDTGAPSMPEIDTASAPTLLPPIN